jgi:hypothetical protein
MKTPNLNQFTGTEHYQRAFLVGGLAEAVGDKRAAYGFHSRLVPE